MRTLALALVLVLALLGASATTACGDDDLTLDDRADATDTPSDPCQYPSGPYGVEIGQVLPNFEFARGDGQGTLSLAELRGRCGERTELLVFRVSAAWCGTCLWSAEHSAELVHDGVTLVDVLVRGRDNGPPGAADVEFWRQRRGAIEAEAPILLDSSFVFQKTEPTLVLPLFLLVEPRSMKVLTAHANVDGDRIAERVSRELRRQRGESVGPPSSFPLYDGLLSRMEWEMVQAMALPAEFAPPPDPTDAHADDPRAAALGRRLFEDTGFSPNDAVSCATCHDAALGFGDGLPTSVGLERGDRNAPGIAFAAHQRWQFWDGRVDTLWAQALLPFEDPLEIGSSRVQVVRRIAERYRAEFEALYGALPPIEDPRFPNAGKPGEPAWDALSAADQEAVSRAFASVGKAIAAFERTLRVSDSALDRYARGDLEALSGSARLGLRMFFHSGCAQCHYGPRLTDDAFHTVRFPSGRRDGAPDVGRSEGLLSYSRAEFGAASRYSDAITTRPEALLALGESMLVGQFKTPSLRGVARSAPFGHGGTELDLRAVTKLYGERAEEVDPSRTTGELEPWLPAFDTGAQQQLADLLETFHAEPRP